MGKQSVCLRWHTLVIVACILLFSLLCWLGLARAGVSKVSKKLAKEDSVIGTSDGLAVTKDDSDEIAESVSDTTTDYVALINQYIHMFDGKWKNHMFLKKKISKVDSMLTYYVTGEICSGQVLLGKENWLFYKSSSDGNPIADYEGTNKHSEDELRQMLYEISRAQDAVEDMGARFVVVIPPNKENIYADYMPDIYQHAETSRTDILVDYLEKDVNIIFPKQQLLDSHMDMM